LGHIENLPKHWHIGNAYFAVFSLFCGASFFAIATNPEYLPKIFLDSYLLGIVLLPHHPVVHLLLV